VSKYRTPFDVWAEKSGLVTPRKPEDESDEMAAGRFLEPFIRDRFEMKTGLVLKRVPVLVRKGTILGGHPDDLACQKGIKEPFAVFEAKTRSPYLRNLWGDEGSDAIPDDEMAQVQFYMHLTGLSVAYVAALFDRMLSIFRVARDQEFGEIAEAAAEKFWRDYVETGTPPPLRGMHVDAYIKRKFPRALNPEREPTPEERELVAKIQDATAAQKAAEAAWNQARNELKMRIGDAAGLKAPGLSVYFRERSGRRTVDTDALLTAIKNEIAISLATEHAAPLIEKVDRYRLEFTKTGEPFRELRIYPAKGDLE
jgi:predicted phage-related endonuclease